MSFLQDVTQCGLSDVADICRRHKAAEISSEHFVRAAMGSFAQAFADDLDDDDPLRSDLFDYVGETEDWFQERFFCGNRTFNPSPSSSV